MESNSIKQDQKVKTYVINISYTFIDAMASLVIFVLWVFGIVDSLLWMFAPTFLIMAILLLSWAYASLVEHKSISNKPTYV